MSPIQQMLLGVGAVATKTYVDDIFSTFLYYGNCPDNNLNTTQTITNGIDLAGEGGLVWTKHRTGLLGSAPHVLVDTERGVNKYLSSNDSDAEVTENSIFAFNSNGFTLKGQGPQGGTNYGEGSTTTAKYTSWTFRKAPGFFDVVTYTGNATARTISHSLGCVPGCIMIKRTDSSDYWAVYHRGNADSNNAGHYFLKLNETSAKANGDTRFNDTEPTASVFSIGNSDAVNANNGTYVAYVFAGGESTAATARSVDFDGSDDQLTMSGHADLSAGTGDYTWECWIKPDNWDHTYSRLFESDNQGLVIGHNNWGSGNVFEVRWNAYSYLSTSSLPEIGQWTHVAFTKQHTGGSTYIKLFYNGTLVKSDSWSGGNTMPTANNITIGNDQANSAYDFDGKISNLRIVKGTALYTSSFRPTYEPLTNVTNTKLLCCNNSSVTGSTVTPSTISAAGGPTASTDSPFDDPAGFVFGDAGDQNVIKCGSYVGSGSAGLEVNVGFEPQWIIFKNASASYNWYVLDVMRGIVSGGDDAILAANDNGAEWDSSYIDVTPTGFKLQTSHALGNGSGNTYVYMCLRRPDGYCGKPPELGTGVFNIANADSTAPAFNANFPVDFAMFRRITTSYDWRTSARLIQTNYLKTNTDSAESIENDYVFDYNDGWNKQTAYDASIDVSWMWKRHAGFDCIAYDGDGVSGRQVTHSLNKTVEMAWIKCRSDTKSWQVYHKGLNGGTNPQNYILELDESNAEGADSSRWNNTAPTSTHFTLGNSSSVNSNVHQYLMMLFASVDGISKVGYYTGSGSNQSVTTGFQPRFIFFKRTSYAEDWFIFDSLRGLVSGSPDPYLRPNSSAAQVTTASFFDISSTGFTVTANFTNNANNYIYYAHA